MNKKRLLIGVPVVAALCVGGYLVWPNSVIGPCLRLAQGGFRPVAATRIERFLGKVQAATAACRGDRKSTRLNSSHGYISYAVFCLKKKKIQNNVVTATAA